MYFLPSFNFSFSFPFLLSSFFFSVNGDCLCPSNFVLQVSMTPRNLTCYHEIWCVAMKSDILSSRLNKFVWDFTIMQSLDFFLWDMNTEISRFHNNVHAAIWFLFLFFFFIASILFDLSQYHRSVLLDCSYNFFFIFILI